jgi:hypothetical protein
MNATYQSGKRPAWNQKVHASIRVFQVVAKMLCDSLNRRLGGVISNIAWRIRNSLLASSDDDCIVAFLFLNRRHKRIEPINNAEEVGVKNL